MGFSVAKIYISFEGYQRVEERKKWLQLYWVRSIMIAFWNRYIS
jgi:hypothetical protein